MTLLNSERVVLNIILKTEKMLNFGDNLYFLKGL